MDVLASTIRPAAQAPDGYLFIDADLNAIENRVLGWLAECEKILRVFKLKRDPYIDFVTYLFHMAYDDLMAEYKAGDSSKRTIAKPGVLGCGYMLGAGEERGQSQDRREGSHGPPEATHGTCAGDGVHGRAVEALGGAPSAASSRK